MSHRLIDKYGPQPWRDCVDECKPDAGLHVHTIWTSTIAINDTPEERRDRFESILGVIRHLNPDIDVLSISLLDPYSATPYEDTPDRYLQPWRIVTVPKGSVALQSEGVVS